MDSFCDETHMIKKSQLPLAIAPSIMCLTDLALTLGGQSPDYWNDASLDVPPEHPKQRFTVQHLLALWPVRFLAYVGSVTFSLHTIAVAISLNSAAKWTIVFTLPVVKDAFWKWYSVNRLGYHPGSLSVWEHVQIGLLIDSVACISLAAAILAILQLTIGTMSTKQNEFR